MTEAPLAAAYGDRPLVAEIARKASAISHVRLNELMGAGRTRDIARIRFAIYLAARRWGWSTPQIGRVLNRDHTTVLDGSLRAEAIAAEDPAYAAFIEELAQ